MLSPAQSAFNTSYSFIENALELLVKPANHEGKGYFDRKCMCHSARGGADPTKYVIFILRMHQQWCRYSYVRL